MAIIVTAATEIHTPRGKIAGDSIRSELGAAMSVMVCLVAGTQMSPESIRCGRVTRITRNQFCLLPLLLKSVVRSDSLRAQWRDAPLPKQPRRTHRLGRERGRGLPPP